MRSRASGRAFMVAALVGSVLLSMPATAAESNDKTTGLPLHPGLTFQQEVSSPVCGHAAQMNLYDAPQTATLAEYVSWYKEHLKGFHHVHKVWSKRAQELFYNSDGSNGVGLTGSATGPGVFAVSYMKMSVKLTTRQMDAFDPSNPHCK
ncbi:MAG: hypothetical protein M3167_11645 [Acidobacteriota bacterium]|nr:hypothetical protein [Acidobacteriota bacterium]